MRYNELTYHKASPFYKQDYLPDRAWYNRKPKEYPSEIPTGQEYFTDNGRKHYAQKFNHSQIEEKGVLTSPQRYPFENRIALDKGYMRNLDTIDIEGASSGTRMNQSIKNKLLAQEEIARRYNQSLEVRDHKAKIDDVKRRDMAKKQFETLQDRKNRPPNELQDALESSRISQNPEKPPPEDFSSRPPLNFAPTNATYGSKYVHLLPKPYYTNTEQPKPQKQAELNQKQQYLPQPQEKQQQFYKNETPRQRAPSQHQSNYSQQNPPSEEQRRFEQQRRYQEQKRYEEQKRYDSLEEGPVHSIQANNRFKSNPQYLNSYDNEWQKRRQEYVKNMEMDEFARNKLQDKRQFRKYNPTNLSFNLAAQSIVGNMH